MLPPIVCVCICVCSFLLRGRRTEKVIQGANITYFISYFYNMTNKKEHFYWLKFEKKEVFMMKS